MSRHQLERVVGVEDKLPVACGVRSTETSPITRHQGGALPDLAQYLSDSSHRIAMDRDFDHVYIW